MKPNIIFKLFGYVFCLGCIFIWTLPLNYQNLYNHYASYIDESIILSNNHILTRNETSAVIRHGYLHSAVLQQPLPLAESKLSYNCSEAGIPFNITIDNLTMQEINQLYTSDVRNGGSWKPTKYIERSKVAIILPYMNRQSHLQIFIRNIIPFLKMQNKSFTILLLEQTGPELFNRAQLMNAGFIESQKLGNYSCFIFHDVDMIPVNLCNVYECPKDGMRHLGLSRDLKNPHLEYVSGIGGVSAFTKEVFHEINGFTNVMFGWGGEDDDGYQRLKRKHFPVHRHRPPIGNYFHITQPNSDSKNPRSGRTKDAVDHNKYMKYDGLNTVNYKLINVTKEPLFTRILISIPGPTNRNEVKPYFYDKRKQFQHLLNKE